MTELSDSDNREIDEKDFDIEIEDDTPEEDRGREPLPKEIAEELDNDDLEEYSEKVKQRLKQYKKQVHDERRAREKLERENREAVAATQRMLERQRQLQTTLTEGEKAYIQALQRAAQLEMEVAKRSFREAQEIGDTDKIVDAQEKFNEASYKLQQASSFQPSLQIEENTVETPIDRSQPPAPDTKTQAWQERNTWFGSDEEMTASALGLHQRLIRERGPQFAGSDDYWNLIDTTMRKRFPEYFGEEDVEAAKPAPREKAATVVAPATRSRSPKKIRLTASQVSIAKKLGVTPEAYAKEMMKLEN